MNLYKYNVAFILINALLIVSINRSISGGWFFELLLLIWLLSTAVFATILGYAIKKWLPAIKPALHLMIVYLASFIAANSLLALHDPLGVGWFNNLVRTYQDPGTLYLIILPYASATAIVCVWAAASKKVKSRALNGTPHQAA